MERGEFMGTSYKGDSPTFRNIRQNLEIAKENYSYKNGYFGTKGQGRDFTRNIKTSDPVREAKTFYDTLTYGGIESSMPNGKGKTTRLADGSIISYREVSHSADGSPAVELNIKRSKDAAGIRYQKIHFIR